MRGIQYDAASRLKHGRLWNTGRPVFPVESGTGAERRQLGVAV
jgi:hypothetical protein